MPVINDVELLDLMMADLAKQRAPIRPQGYWAEAVDSIWRATRRYGIEQFRADRRSTPRGLFTDALDLDPSVHWHTLGGRLARFTMRLPGFATIHERYITHQKYMWTQASKIRDLYMNEVCGPWYKGLRELRKLPETTAAGSSNNVRICGDAVAMGYLGAFAHLQTFESCVNFPGIKSCVVLGGGFGHEAHTLLSLWPNITKIVYVDIPPMLYYGSQYLKSVLGGAEVIDYRVTRALSQVVLADVPEKVVAIPPWEIDKIIGSIEFLYNSCSLQEMGSDNVSFYAKAFQRLLDKSARLSFVMWATDNTVAQLGGRDLTHSEVLDRFEYVNFQELAGPTVRIEADAYNYYCGTVAS